MRKTFVLAAALTAGCGGAELRYAPAQPPFALQRERLAPIASVRFADASGGMQSMGTGLMLKRHFYDSFRDAMGVSLASLGVSTGAASGADLEIVLTQTRLDRGAGLNADLTATVRYVVRASRGGQPACEREGSGWAVLRESLVSSPDAKAVEVALTKAADGLGAVLASSCLYAASSTTVADASSDIDAAPSPGRRDPHLLVLAFGAERYRGEPPARFAGADARAFAACAKAALGAADERVALAVDEDTTYASLRKYVDGWIPNRMGVGDAVIVYFAGRGATEGATGKAYLAPIDADPAYLPQTAYPVAELLTALGRLPAKVTLILDAGFSGVGPRAMTPPGMKPFAVDTGLNIPANVTVVAAARGDEVVNDARERGHGLFTDELLKALRAAPALRPAFETAKIEVEAAARRDFSATQTPQWSPK